MRVILLTRTAHLKLRELIREYGDQECFAFMSGFEGQTGMMVHNLYNVTTKREGETGLGTAESKEAMRQIKSSGEEFIGLFQTHPRTRADVLTDEDLELLNYCFDLNNEKPIENIIIDPFADTKDEIIHAFDYSRGKSGNLILKLVKARNEIADFPLKDLKTLINRYLH